MNRKQMPYLLLFYDSYKFFFFGVLFFPLLLQWSCISPKCILCETGETTVYKVQLNEEAQKITGKSEFETFFLPELIEIPPDTSIYLVDCDRFNPFDETKSRLDILIRKNTFVVDYNMINRITTTSDADNPPTIVNLKSIEKSYLCNRTRSALKLELRSFMGARINRNYDEVFYSSYTGNRIDTLVDANSTVPRISIGIEAAIMSRIKARGARNAFSPGILIGYWPFGQSVYIPISFHPRFTFNEISSPLEGRCNASYVYADFGTAWNMKEDVPVVSNYWVTTWFTGFGLGRDIWMSRDNDFSIDIGYRFSSLALPFKPEYQEVLESEGRRTTVEYPHRRTSQLYVRFGVTW